MAEEDDDFEASIKRLKVQIRGTVRSSKIAKHIVKRSLEPILDQLQSIYKVVLHDIGKSIIEVLKDDIAKRADSGKTYLIVQFNPEVPQGLGGRYEVIDEYTASDVLASPAKYTGALESSLGFEVTSQGLLRVGQTNVTPWGWSKSKKELTRKSVFFRGNKIFINDEIGRATPVEDYAKYLESGTHRELGSMAARPWISETIREMQPAIKALIKEEIHAAIKRRTRSKQVQEAFTFRVFIARD